MSLARHLEVNKMNGFKESRSRSVQGLANFVSSPVMKIPLPPRLWITGKCCNKDGLC